MVSIYSVGLERDEPPQESSSRRRYPTAQLHVEYMRPDKIYEAVRDDAADLGLVSYPESSREIAAIPWRQEEMHVAVPPNHPFAARAEVYPADLNGYDFIGFDEDLRIRRELDRFLRAQGIEVNLVMHFDNIQMIKEAVALGSGNQHSAGAHHAGGDRTGAPGGGQAECAGPGASAGHRAPPQKEIQPRHRGPPGHAAGGVGQEPLGVKSSGGEMRLLTRESANKVQRLAGFFVGWRPGGGRIGGRLGAGKVVVHRLV